MGMILPADLNERQTRKEIGQYAAYTGFTFDAEGKDLTLTRGLTVITIPNWRKNATAHLCADGPMKDLDTYFVIQTLDMFIALYDGKLTVDGKYFNMKFERRKRTHEE